MRSLRPNTLIEVSLLKKKTYMRGFIYSEILDRDVACHDLISEAIMHIFQC